MSAHADKEGVEFLRKRGEGHIFADHGVVADLDAQISHEIDLSAEYGPGKTVVGDAHGRHAARLGQPLEYRDAVAHLAKVVGHREPRGARAQDGDFFETTAPFGDRPSFPLVQLVVCGKPLQVFDRDRLVHVRPPAIRLAGPHADPAEGACQAGVLPDGGERGRRHLFCNLLDISWYFQFRGAGAHARRGDGDAVSAASALHPLLHGAVEGLPEIGKGGKERDEAGLSYLALRPFLDIRGQIRDPLEVRLIPLPFGYPVHHVEDDAGAHTAGDAPAARLVLDRFDVPHAHVDHIDGWVPEHQAVPAHESLYRLVGKLLGDGEPQRDGVIVFRFTPVVHHFSLPCAEQDACHDPPYLSISPSTMSTLPMAAITSATICPSIIFGTAARFRNEGGRMRNR